MVFAMPATLLRFATSEPLFVSTWPTRLERSLCRTSGALLPVISQTIHRSQYFRLPPPLDLGTGPAFLDECRQGCGGRGLYRNRVFMMMTKANVTRLIVVAAAWMVGASCSSPTGSPPASSEGTTQSSSSAAATGGTAIHIKDDH